MKKDNTKSKSVILPERLHFESMLAKNPNYFGNIPGSKLKASFQLVTDTSYEELTCVGYNPDTSNMEATFSIKRSVGYLGNLCTRGSFEYVRFYMDFHDGAGFKDQGWVRVNVHDIPAEKDCKGKSIFPIKYVATLKRKGWNISSCKHPKLPTLRAILSWNNRPPADSPDWKPVWGNVMDCNVQLKPWFIGYPFLPKYEISLLKYLDLAKDFPGLTSKEIGEMAGIDLSKISEDVPSQDLQEFAESSKKLKVPATRFMYKTVQKMIQYPTSEISLANKGILSKLKIDINELIDTFGELIPIDKSKANVNYEELVCVGLDYNTESLVATIKIKKENGYNGDLCSKGSKEYVAFWIDWKDKCKWRYLDTVELKVHDIDRDKKEKDLCYTVRLPIDAKYYRKLCSNPNIIRVRAVLSWNALPSTTNPDKLEYYGNRLDAHIQIKPGFKIVPGEVFPLFNIIGGIDVGNVDNSTGLTKPGAFFAFNGLHVPGGAPFTGVIVLNGPSFPGYRYKIRITNLNNGTVTYATNSFTVVGHLPHAPWVQYTTQSVDSQGYYPFLPHDKNTLNVLARIPSLSEDKFRVEIEIDTVSGSFSKAIQIDNTLPEVILSVDDGGDCTHYKQGDTITGHYYVYDKYIRNWSFGSTWGGAANGVSNTPGLPGAAFGIVTTANAHPCGSVSLVARDKTIVNSQSLRGYVRRSYNVCLQDA